MRKLYISSTLAALAIGTLLSLAPAFAGTYEDNVFRPGEPRWGSSSRHFEDRNIRRGYGHGMRSGHQQRQNRSSRSYREMRMERWSRTTMRGGQGMRGQPMRPLVSQVVGTPAVFECDEIRCRSVR